MNRLTTPLTIAYCLGSLAMLYFAITSQQNGQAGPSALFATCAVLFGLAVGHHAHHRDELRFARAQLERRTRPPDPRPAIDGVVAVAMAGWCCDAWAATAGTDHDPATCTRKDQTT